MSLNSYFQRHMFYYYLGEMIFSDKQTVKREKNSRVFDNCREDSL